MKILNLLPIPGRKTLKKSWLLIPNCTSVYTLTWDAVDQRLLPRTLCPCCGPSLRLQGRAKDVSWLTWGACSSRISKLQLRARGRQPAKSPVPSDFTATWCSPFSGEHFRILFSSSDFQSYLPFICLAGLWKVASRLFIYNFTDLETIFAN